MFHGSKVLLEILGKQVKNEEVLVISGQDYNGE